MNSNKNNTYKKESTARNSYGGQMGSVTKPENTLGKNLIKRSHKRKNVEQTGADATLCKQSETRHRDESFPLDQSPPN